jgi:hypothetical protein
LFNPRHEPIDINLLYTDLNDLGKLINTKLREKKVKKVKSVRITTAAGVHKKTRKNTTNSKNNNTSNGKKFSFKRTPKRRKFRNPIFLSLK